MMLGFGAIDLSEEIKNHKGFLLLQKLKDKIQQKNVRNLDQPLLQVLVIFMLVKHYGRQKFLLIKCVVR